MIRFFLTEMNALLLLGPRRVARIPFGTGATREAMRESRRLRQAQRDPFYAQYVPQISSLGPLLLMERLTPTSYSPESMEPFFTSALEAEEAMPTVPAIELIDREQLEFLLSACGLTPEKYQRFLSDIYLPSSSAHGDFHAGNIMLRGDDIKLIDWSNFSLNSSRLFDLIDYHVCADGSVSWIERLGTFLETEPCLAGRQTSCSELAAYSLWKAAKETRALRLYGRFGSAKVKKYKVLLNKIDTTVSKRNDP